MGSENKMNDGTSFQQSDKQILCANGCGFFGTAATMNLCSKCYRDHRLKEEQAASAIAAVEKSMASILPPPLPETVVVVPEKLIDVREAVGTLLAVDTALSDPAPVKVPTKCGSCNKRVGLTGFKCKCGTSFCGSHRYPEQHDCTFDFKGVGREAIAKANPVVKADKVARF